MQTTTASNNNRSLLSLSLKHAYTRESSTFFNPIVILLFSCVSFCDIDLVTHDTILCSNALLI